MLNYSIGILIILLFIVVIYKISVINEKKSYNKGICPKCGFKLNLSHKNYYNKECIYECPRCGNAIFLYWYDPEEDKKEGD